ncbi:MAG: fructosamine kinase family protein [Myxococcota bacterium]
MNKEIVAAASSALGSPIVNHERLSGGDINDAYLVGLEDGRRAFLKTNPRAPATMFDVEARGLSWLQEARALRVPEVLAVSPRTADVGFLCLEYLAPGRRKSMFDEELGRGLATLHRFGASSFGLGYDNFIGSLPQRNVPRPTWTEFYRSERLEAQLKLASDTGRASPRLTRRFGELFTRLEAIVGDEEPPARLHGDLWGGNLHCDDQGGPCLIDPAVYGGHREVDLAMMKLFSGFSARVFDAYHEAFPLQPEWENRVDLYQLYPLLVHLNLFGGSYTQSVERAVQRYL